MNKIYKKAQEAVKKAEVQEAARILAKYNLGIFVPHMHDTQTGELIELPGEVISMERDLKITFVPTTDIESGTVPVAWRWNGNNVEVCGSCCTAPNDPGAG